MGNASTKQEPPVESAGGVIAPDSWDTDAGAFLQISPTSDISAPSKFVGFDQGYRQERSTQLRAKPHIENSSCTFEVEHIGQRKPRKYREHPKVKEYALTRKGKHHEDPREQESALPKNRAELLAGCFTGCIEESAHKLEKIRTQVLPIAQKSNKVKKKVAHAAVATKTTKKNTKKFDDLKRTDFDDDTSDVSSLYIDEAVDLSDSKKVKSSPNRRPEMEHFCVPNNHEKINVSKNSFIGEANVASILLIGAGLKEANVFQHDLNIGEVEESNRSVQTNRFEVSSINYEGELSGLGPSLLGLKEANKFRYEDPAPTNMPKTSRDSIDSVPGKTQKKLFVVKGDLVQIPQKEKMFAYDPGQELEENRRHQERKLKGDKKVCAINPSNSGMQIKGTTKPLFETTTEQLGTDLHTEIAFHNEDEFLNRLSFSQDKSMSPADDQSLKHPCLESILENCSNSSNAHTSENGICDIDSPVASLFPEREKIAKSSRNADKETQGKRVQAREVDYHLFIKKEPKSDQKLAHTSQYDVDASWLTLTPEPQPTHPRLVLKAEVNKNQIFRRKPCGPARHKLESKSAEEAINHNNSEASMGIHLTESAPSVLETYHENQTRTLLRPTNYFDAVPQNYPTMNFEENDSKKSANNILAFQSKPRKPKVDSSLGVEHCVPESKTRTGQIMLSALEGSCTKDGPRSNKTAPCLWDDSLLETSQDASTSQLLSDQALSNAAFLFSPSYAEEKPQLQIRPSPARTISMSISTSGSRKRLSSLPGRSSQSFTIPISVSQYSGMPRLKSHTASRELYNGRHVRFSDANHTKTFESNKLSVAPSLEKADTPRTSVYSCEHSSTSQPSPEIIGKKSIFSRTTLQSVLTGSSSWRSEFGGKILHTRKDPTEQIIEECELLAKGGISESGEESFRVSVHEMEKGTSCAVAENPIEASSSIDTEASIENVLDQENPYSFAPKDTETSGWTYLHTMDGDLSHVTPCKGGLAIRNASPMKRFYAARNQFSPHPSTHGALVRRISTTKFHRMSPTTSPETGLILKKSKIDGCLKAKRPLILKSVRRETGGQGAIAPRKPILINPIFGRCTVKEEDNSSEEDPQCAKTQSHNTAINAILLNEEIRNSVNSEEDNSSFFVKLRESKSKDSLLGTMSNGEFSDDETETDAFIMSKPSIDTSEAPSVATLVREFGRKIPTRTAAVYGSDNDDKENGDSVANTSDLPSFGSKALVDPRGMQHHHPNATPGNLCLSPTQRTPMQARKWRSLAAEAKEKERSKQQGKKTRNAFKERSLNIH